MNDSFGGDFNATTSGGAATEQKPEGVVPVVLKQILECLEGNFQMWGMTFGMVTCVGIVRSIDISSTKITYDLEDHTGRIDCHFWLDEGDALKSPDIMINNYARVFGSIRQHGGKKTLMVFKMTSVTNINEISTHLLEVLNARYKAEEFSKKGAGGTFSDFSVSGNGNQDTSAAVNIGLDSKHTAVYVAIKNNVAEEGVSRQELERKFSHISKRELETILDFMTSEGHIYTSTDHDHFLSTDC